MKRFLNLINELKLPLIMLGILFFIYLFGEKVPHGIASFFLAISYSIKNIIIGVLPLMIIIYVSSSLMQLKKGAFKFAAIILFFIVFSNFISVWYSFELFKIFSPNFETLNEASQSKINLLPLWNFPEIKFISNDAALVLGFSIGIIFAFFENNKYAKYFELARFRCNNLLNWILLPSIPFFVGGFALKTAVEGNLSGSLLCYGKILIYFTTFQLLYAAISFMIASSLELKKALKLFKNILPVTITGFATFSSAATMPVTIAAARKNLENQKIAEAFIPTTANIHLLGTSIGKIVIIMSVFTIFGKSLPNEIDFLIFSIFFTITQFAVIGVPGGTIFVQTPIIENYLGASPEMIAIITMLVLLFDPIDTSFNVTLNSTFAVIFEKFAKLFGFKHSFNKTQVLSNK